MRNCSRMVSIASCLLAFAMTAPATQTEQPKTSQPKTKVVTKTIPSPVRFEFSRNVGAGRVKKVKVGAPGSVKRTYRLIEKNGKVVGKILLKEERTEPEASLYLMGRAGWSADRGSYVRSRVLTMRATGYDPSPETIGPGATGYTRMGIRARYGVVAVDPRVIPLGSLVFVEGYGFAYASDTGSAIKGMRIDLCFNSRDQAMDYGVKTVRVHVLSRPR